MGQVLFQAWILSFLLYQVDIVGSLSIDNLMVPILVFAWLFAGDRKDVDANRARLKMVAVVTSIFLFLIVMEVVKLEPGANIAEVFAPIVAHLKHYGYILIPLLYVSSEKTLKWTLMSLLVITIINSAMAVLGAFGVAPSFVLAAESTRIPGLLRARGPIANFGDTALLTSFMSLLILSLARHKINFISPRAIVRVAVLSIMIAGVIATQSRNVILTIAMAFTVYYWLRLMMQGSGGTIRILLSMFGIGVFLAGVTLVVLNADAIISWVTNMFGVSGEGTVRDRLESYSHAFSLLKGSFLFGLSSSEMARNASFIATIHNMWLGMALLTGIVGVSLLFAMIIASLYYALRLTRSRYWKEYGLVLASFILASLWFSPNFYPGHNAFIFWFCIGIALTAKQTFCFVREESLVQQSDLSLHGEQLERGGRNPKSRILKYKAT